MHLVSFKGGTRDGDTEALEKLIGFELLQRLPPTADFNLRYEVYETTPDWRQEVPALYVYACTVEKAVEPILPV